MYNSRIAARMLGEDFLFVSTIALGVYLNSQALAYGVFGLWMYWMYRRGLK